MTNQKLTLDDIKPRNGWTYDPDTDVLYRHAETFTGSGCNLCGGYQNTDPDGDMYCPHMEGGTEHVKDNEHAERTEHTERIEIRHSENTVVIWEGPGYERERFPINREEIINWMETYPSTRTE